MSVHAGTSNACMRGVKMRNSDTCINKAALGVIVSSKWVSTSRGRNAGFFPRAFRHVACRLHA